jgi:hypothetical protein
MDLSKFKTSDWLKIGGGAGFALFGLFSWASVDGFGSGGNAFDWPLRGAIPWLLFVAIAVLSVLLLTGKIDSQAQPWGLIMLGAAALGTLLNLMLVLPGPSASAGGIKLEFDRGFGLLLAFISAVVCLVGCVLSFKESGGDLNDLKDVNKLKAAFDNGTPPAAGGGDMPPPPPPPPPMPS